MTAVQVGVALVRGPVAADPPASARAAADAGVEALFEAQYARMCRLAALLVSDRDLAEEVVMDAFVRVHGSWGRIRDLDRVDAYLRRTVVNLARTTLRRRRTERGAVALAESRAATDPTQPGEEQWVLGAPVLAAVRALPPRQRAAVVLRFYADLSEADIADSLDCSVGTVKSQLSKARARLSRDLAPLYADSAPEDRP